MFAKIQQIHFVGIGGIGMSGIAEVLLNLGYKVSGSDLKGSAVTQRLAGLGAAVFERHAPENINGAEVVVTSSAIAEGNLEVAEARKLHIPVIPRAEMLAVVTNIDREHMDCYRNMRDVKNTFLEFMDRVPFYGMVVACNDDGLLRRLLPRVQRRTLTYGTKRGSDFHIKLKSAKASGLVRGHGQPLSRFRVSYHKQDLGEFTLHVPGIHNMLNATAAIAVAIALAVGVAPICGTRAPFT